VSHSVVIVEDEPPARAKLVRFLAAYEDFRVLAEVETVESAIEAIRSTSPDVVYLDIQLGTESGFEVLDGTRGFASPLVVFTTAYSQHAVRAFEVQALDYLLKPFDQDRFESSIARVRGALAEPDRSDLE
jgi:two-component system LytT family response regulator